MRWIHGFAVAQLKALSGRVEAIMRLQIQLCPLHAVALA